MQQRMGVYSLVSCKVAARLVVVEVVDCPKWRETKERRMG